MARGDSIDVIDRVKVIAADFEPGLPEDIAIDLVNDSTGQIRDSIDVLLSNALQGLVLLSVILLFFLGLCNALMTALGIPVTFAVTFLILEALGETINSNTLFGLVLVLGLIVDHATVITENTYRLRTLGYDKRRAAIEGTSQVAWPIVVSSLTTVAAFLPLMILPGTIGKFLRVIPLVVSIALVASTIEAILFIPAHAVEWPGGDSLKLKPDLFDRIRPCFEGFIKALYRKRLLVVLGFVVLAGGIFSTIPLIRQDLFSAEGFSLFYIDIDLPTGTNRARTESVIRMFEERIQPMQGKGEVVNVISSVGFRIRGDDYEALVASAAQLRGRLAAYPELFNIVDTLQTGTPELRILINEELDIVVRYAGTGGAGSIGRLLELKIPTPNGRQVPFSAIAELDEGAALAAIKRVDGKREVGVDADAYTKDNVQAINSDIKAWFETEVQSRYPGLELVVGGEFAELADLLIQILRVFLLGLFLIYAVLGAQFKSFTQPLLILLSVPMAFAGVILYLVLSGTPFSTTVLYAGVDLAGIAVNDSIVLIDFVNVARKEGKAVGEAVVEAASVRLRPILLTSVTTIGGRKLAFLLAVGLFLPALAMAQSTSQQPASGTSRSAGSWTLADIAAKGS